MGDQALIIYFEQLGTYAEEANLEALDALHMLEAEVRQVVTGGVGEVDGHEIALDDSEGSLFMYGPDAKAMLRAALPAICSSPLAQQGEAYLRYGEAGDDTAEEETFLLADLCARRNG